MYIFVIDTEEYSGNFERDMCAYMTGCVGDCGVGEKFAKLFELETGMECLDGVIDQIDDEDDAACRRPCSIWPTPGWVNNGRGADMKVEDSRHLRRTWPAYLSVAIFFEKKPNKKTLGLLMERARNFLTLDGEPKQITSFRLMKRITKDRTEAQWDQNGMLSEVNQKTEGIES